MVVRYTFIEKKTSIQKRKQLTMKIRTLIQIISIVGLTFLGCDNNSTNSKVHELVGRWKWQGATFYVGSINSPDSTYEDTPSYSEVPGEEEWWEIDFKGDNSLIWYIFIDGNYPVLTGIWTTDNNILSITMDENEWGWLENGYTPTYSITGDILSLTSEHTASEFYPFDWQVSKYERMN